MTEAEAQKRFDAWYNDKQAKIQAKRDGLDAAAEKEMKDRLLLSASRTKSALQPWLLPRLSRCRS